MSEKPSCEELVQRVLQLEKAESERNQAEEELQKKENIIQRIFDAAPVGICIMKKRVYQRVNRDWCERFGYQEVDIIGRTTAFLYITARKQAEEALRDSEIKYRNLFDNARIGLFRTRASDGIFLEANLQISSLHGSHHSCIL